MNIINLVLSLVDLKTYFTVVDLTVGDRGVMCINSYTHSVCRIITLTVEINKRGCSRLIESCIIRLESDTTLAQFCTVICYSKIIEMPTTIDIYTSLV